MSNIQFIQSQTEVEKPKKKVKSTKVKSIIFSWLFCLLSFFIPLSVPEAKETLEKYNLMSLLNIFRTEEFIRVVIIVGFLSFVFALMYLIDFLRKKYLPGYSVNPETTFKELEGALKSFRIFFISTRIFVIFLGLIVLIARILGLDIAKQLF